MYIEPSPEWAIAAPHWTLTILPFLACSLTRQGQLGKDGHPHTTKFPLLSTQPHYFVGRSHLDVLWPSWPLTQSLPRAKGIGVRATANASCTVLQPAMNITCWNSGAKTWPTRWYHSTLLIQGYSAFDPYMGWAILRSNTSEPSWVRCHPFPANTCETLPHSLTEILEVSGLGPAKGIGKASGRMMIIKLRMGFKLLPLAFLIPELHMKMTGWHSIIF